jgi:hypothetical protein
MQQFTDLVYTLIGHIDVGDGRRKYYPLRTCLNKGKKAGSGNKGLYTIAPLLIEETNLLPIQIQLVFEGKLKKLQRRHVRTN